MRKTRKTQLIYPKWTVFFLALLFTAQPGLSQYTNAFVHISIESAPMPILNEQEVITTSFDLVEGMIFVEGNLNGESGSFVFDTGAPLIVVNNGGAHSSSIAQASGVSSAFGVEEVEVRSFQWAGIEQGVSEAVAIDMSHLEAVAERKILGLIGYEVFRQYEILIDYRARRLHLYKGKAKQLHKTTKPKAVIPFGLQGHLPVIKAKIGGKSYVFGLDTGSEINLMDASKRNELPSDLLEAIQLEEIQGVDQVVQQAEAATIISTSVKGLAFDQMRYLFTDLTHLSESSGLRIDGLLGFPFFSQYTCSINYKAQKIYIWK